MPKSKWDDAEKPTLKQKTAPTDAIYAIQIFVDNDSHHNTLGYTLEMKDLLSKVLWSIQYKRHPASEAQIFIQQIKEHQAT